MPPSLRLLLLGIIRFLSAVIITALIVAGLIGLLTLLTGCASTRPPRDGEILIPIPDWAQTQILDLPDCKG